ncbi:histone deacetylase HDT3-like [Phragmites australis]|uniref:histone deacetylase HDT3-like n=1 Tax=Phragmites australis TaxID=29695 RepID=UPI002D77B4F8|nr:histone deacetylase HDT3-like [Phragmites australis]
MEFWGEEVKPGVTVSCEVGDGYVIHLSQAAVGETKKGSENVVVSVKVNDKKLVIGTLSAEKHPQIMCDLIFDQKFELSHSSKTTSVFLCGYKSQMPDMFESDSGEDEDEELETEQIPMTNNVIEKSAAKVPVKDSKKDEQETSSGDDDLSDDSEDDSMSDDESSGDDDISDDSEDEETPEKPEVGKKRASETGLKTPSDKKAKISTPSGQKTGDKKGVHVATPHPAKQASKASKIPADSKSKEKAPKTPADSKSKEKAPRTPADSKSKEKAPKTPADSKSKEKTPKSGSHACKSCSKTFGSAGAMEAHQKAKH